MLLFAITSKILPSLINFFTHLSVTDKRSAGNMHSLKLVGHYLKLLLCFFLSWPCMNGTLICDYGVRKFARFPWPKSDKRHLTSCR